MSFGLLNWVALFGLAALIIPPLIHLLNRRRYDVIDWGAMQFLKVSEKTRRKLLIEELLLMALRILLIALLVLAVAAPFVESPILAKIGGRPNRDVVLLIDGSASMSDTSSGKSTQQAAQEWIDAYLADLSPGDGVAVLQVREQPVPVQRTLTGDVPAVRKLVRELPPPRGGCDWREAFRAAFAVLADSHKAEREVVVVTDNQRFGWADDTSLLRWELFATELKQAGTVMPRIWAVNLAPQRPADPANWSLAPLKPNRAVSAVGQEVRFRTAMELHGQSEYLPPHRLRLEVDGRPVRDLTPPAGGKLDKGQVTYSFTHRFDTPGSHLVSLVVEPDPPADQRPAGYKVKDVIPADNRQDYAVEVLPALPVLLVDGDTRPAPKYRGTDFLRDALSPARDPNPSALVRVIPVQQFEAKRLVEDVSDKPGTPPRVLVLSDVATLSKAQEEAVADFLGKGGGVLVTLGERAEAAAYNEGLYRGGDGWLPARLDDWAGDDNPKGRVATPLASSFFHPALELFRDVPSGGLADARFPRWWKVRTVGRGAAGVPVALLSSNDPLLVERQYRRGRVMLCSVPLDNSWHTNLPDLPAFAPLAHELVFYLAGGRGSEHNLEAGQPLRVEGIPESDLPRTTLMAPSGPPRTLEEGDGVRLERGPQGTTAVYETTREPGVYRVELTGRPPSYFVVQSDPRESDLTACNDKERERVAQFVPLTYVKDRDAMIAGMTQVSVRQELWWVGLVAVMVMLCGELWLTRRIVRGR